MFSTWLALPRRVYAMLSRAHIKVAGYRSIFLKFFSTTERMYFPDIGALLDVKQKYFKLSIDASALKVRVIEKTEKNTFLAQPGEA